MRYFLLLAPTLLGVALAAPVPNSNGTAAENADVLPIEWLIVPSYDPNRADQADYALPIGARRVKRDEGEHATQLHTKALTQFLCRGPCPKFNLDGISQVANSWLDGIRKAFGNH